MKWTARIEAGSHSGPGHLFEVATYDPKAGSVERRDRVFACGVVLIDFDLTGEGVSDV
jgi:hypothetical protein